MVVGVARAWAAVEHQRAAIQGGGGSHRLGGVFDALAMAAAVAAGESAGPEQMGDLQPSAAEQIERLRLAAIGELVPPDADGGDSRGHVPRYVLFKGPTKGGRLTDRQFSHPCSFRRKAVSEVCHGRFVTPAAGFAALAAGFVSGFRFHAASQRVSTGFIAKSWSNRF